MSLQLFGRRVLDQVDFLVSTVGLPVGVCITALCLGWKGSSLIKMELQTSERTKQSIVWVVRWLVPGVILLLLISMLLKN